MMTLNRMRIQPFTVFNVIRQLDMQSSNQVSNLTFLFYCGLQIVVELYIFFTCPDVQRICIFTVLFIYPILSCVLLYFRLKRAILIYGTRLKRNTECFSKWVPKFMFRLFWVVYECLCVSVHALHFTFSTCVRVCVLVNVSVCMSARMCVCVVDLPSYWLYTAIYSLKTQNETFS